MPLPSSGPLSLNNIQTEFGGTNPIGMNEYYAGGGLVPAGTTGTFGAVPSSGALSVQNFYGTSNYIPVYIEELFSTWLYNGTGAAQTINNGIDLSGKGGLVWIKTRSNIYSHVLSDTARGATQWLNSATTDASVFRSNYVTAFNSNGFSVGDSSDTSPNFNTMASWTFREQPKFFDVVTFTGNGSTGQTIAHNLQSGYGFIAIKRTDAASDWFVLARDSSGSYWQLKLNSTAAYTGLFSADPNISTVFYPSSVIGAAAVNGSTYVAYIFAHNAGGFGLTGTDNVISCGSFTTDGSGQATVNLGYEPQWVLIKSTNIESPWWMLDTMRGWDESSNDRFLRANSSVAEDGGQFGAPTSTGFFARTQFGASNTFIYIAIRRGPMKVPTTGTSVFNPVTASTDNSAITTNFPADFIFEAARGGSAANFYAGARLTGPAGLITSSTDSELTTAFGSTIWQSNTSVTPAAFGATSLVLEAFRRAPRFFDVVCYTGTGSARTVAHNLTVAPELMIVKTRSATGHWGVYQKDVGAANALLLSATNAAFASNGYWNSTAPTASVFTVGTETDVNQNAQTQVAYLFASCPGVSKVGSFTGTGATQVINCGFTSGSRFVLIKATSTTGDWYVWDSARGIVAGNDPYLRLNSAAAEVTGTDWVDTAASGFELSNAGGNLANSSGVSYIFLAIA